MTDFEDAYQVRALLESQGHLLGTAFQYLMMDGDWKNLQHILRTQKVMRDTMELMNHLPAPVIYHPSTTTAHDRCVNSGQMPRHEAAKRQSKRPMESLHGAAHRCGQSHFLRNSYKHGRYSYERQLLRWYVRLAAIG